MIILEDICPDFNEWPESWMGVEEDRLYGQKILEIIRPFVNNMIEKGMTVRSMRRHLNSLWLLGAEIIYEVDVDGEYDIPPEEKILSMISAEGGPYSSHLDSKTAQEQFDGTCRQLYKFLSSKDD